MVDSIRAIGANLATISERINHNAEKIARPENTTNATGSYRQATKDDNLLTSILELKSDSFAYTANIKLLKLASKNLGSIINLIS